MELKDSVRVMTKEEFESAINEDIKFVENINAKRIERQYLKRLIRRHNRQIHKMKILKGGKKKNNQAPFEVFGFRLFDKVLYNNKIFFVYGRRKSGSFNIRDFNGENSKDVSRKKFKLIRGKRHPIILK